MARSVLNAPHFQNEDEAFAYVEARLWPNGAVCPHCGNADQKRIRKMAGETTRKGLYKCNACRKPFTVRMGTIFESSHLALHLWLQVIHLMCASKKGISTRQIQRMLLCSMKTAWHLTHRIREAMRSGGLAPMGGAGEIVEADETFIGKKEGAQKHPNARGYAHKRAILSLVHRGSGQVRSFHIDNANAANIYPIIDKNLSFESKLMTDESGIYKAIGRSFDGGHESVEHGKGEYVRDECHTNTLEGYFSVFKRGMKGVYQHCAEKHLHRYLAEFDFRYNNRIRLGVDDIARADIALEGFKGKRLTYQTTRH
jgi:transposase-like protein